MPAPHPIELRERAVRAYENGHESYDVVAARFEIAPAALERWVRLYRDTKSVAPKPRGGGNYSPVDLALLEKLVVETGDATTHELTATYNVQVGRARRVHRSSIHRALVRAGYVFKKKSYVQQNSNDRTFSKSVRASSGG
jgi:transposase